MAVELSESSLISNSSGRVAVALSRRFPRHTLQRLLIQERTRRFRQGASIVPSTCIHLMHNFYRFIFDRDIQHIEIVKYSSRKEVTVYKLIG